MTIYLLNFIWRELHPYTKQNKEYTKLSKSFNLHNTLNEKENQNEKSLITLR